MTEEKVSPVTDRAIQLREKRKTNDFAANVKTNTREGIRGNPGLQTNDNIMLNHALAYAARGWLVFPLYETEGKKCACRNVKCEHQGKHPRTGGGLNDATTDEFTLRRWWKQWPTANIGIATGLSGLLVLDVDEGGEDSLVGKDIPHTVESITGSGGRHIFFKKPTDGKYKSCAKFLLGLDSRGDGGYVVAPPSTHESGKTYDWEASSEPEDVALADPPEWFLNEVFVDTSSRRAASSESHVGEGLPNDIADMLAFIPADDRDTWLMVGMGLHNADSKNGFDVWDNWAQTSDKYDADDQARTWNSFQGRADGVTLGTIRYYARQRGWVASDDDVLRDFSHDQIALDWSEYWLDQNARYVALWNRWFLWDGVRWDVDVKNHHKTVARNFLRDKAEHHIKAAEKAAEKEHEPKKAEKIVDNAKNTACKLRSAQTRAAIVETAGTNENVAATTDQWDVDPWLLGTPNGPVDLKTGELLAPRRAHYITKNTAVTPADTAECPQWNAFLERIFPGKPDIIRFLQRAAGYALTGKTTEHKILFAFGTGRNGKGVFFNTLTDIIGEYAKIAPASTFIDAPVGEHSTELARLAGARIVAASELPPGKAWNEARIKSMTGGDPITARGMRQDFFTYDPQFTLAISGNHMPSLRGIDEATRARVLLIPFNETIPEGERDPQLADKLKDQWPGILRWAIDGCLDWQKYGLNAPPEVNAASNDYLDEEDDLGQFTKDCLEIDLSGGVANSELYEAFQVWCEDRGMRAWTQKSFSKGLKERGFKQNNRRAWLGYELSENRPRKKERW